MQRKLIILMGMPRSGTTWLGKIFDSHPDTLYRHEPDSAQRISGVPLFADVVHTDQYRHTITEFADKLSGAWLTKVTATLPVFPKSYYAYPQLLLRKFSILVTKLSAKVFGELPIPEVVDYRKVPQLVLVWKSIESVGRLGVLCRSLPACRAVLILRHPCGYAASVLRGESKRKFTSDTPWHEDFGVDAELLEIAQAKAHGLTLDGIRNMHPVERLAWRWVLSNEKAMEDIARLSNCTYIRYEDLCSDPIAQTRKLFEFSGLDWNGQTEAFIRRSTASDNTAYYSIFKDPLKSANKWKNELAADDIERVLAVIRDTKPGKLYADRMLKS